MRTLIIPDIHQRIKDVDKVIDKETFDKVIFLGDYFDSFKPQGSFEKVCDWVWNKFNELKGVAIWLSGNHDISYYEEVMSHSRWASKTYCAHKKMGCSGYTRNKGQLVKKFFKNKKDFWVNLELFHWDGFFLYSHAGFSNGIFRFGMSFDDNLKYFKVCWDEIKRLDVNYSNDWIIKIGSRAGSNYVGMGGPLWLDWWDEFEPVDGVSQIVGHTICNNPQNKNNNFCIDCCSKYYAIVENGLIETKYVDF